MKPGEAAGTGLLESFGYALSGVRESARGRNFRIQLGFAVAAVALGAAFRIGAAQWIVVVACIGLVLGGECMNTALEAVVDLASPELHPLAKRAKDAAAGAVLCLSAASLVVGVIVFAPPLLQLLGWI